MGFAKQWKGVNGYMLRDPGTFFAEYDETHGIGYPVAFMLVSYFAVVVPLGLLMVVVNITDPIQIAAAVGVTLGFGIVFWVTGIVEALVAHGLAYLFGARGLTETLEAYAFPVVVRYCLWWIPLVNLGLGLYGLYLQIKGLAAFHDLSTGKAAIVALLASVLYLLPVFVVLAAVIGAFVLDLGSQPTPQPAMLVLEVIA
ncbi:YIP1 family protein [Natrinema hispanicum]|uniref:Yip1 domain-containing protein n=1 Tax=Natrinema hispanicum TaxID=392421 RepID=A0A1I0FSN4_9EURY|nr:YIP1 family protein [Natrinema hispanicum]SDC78520.1 hypothetical protein SAMN05192552_1007101 [Natrinema hispanicum]SET61433.1 hypothetical protein SAMN04488694_10974 [Natrinema hispanicum]